MKFQSGPLGPSRFFLQKAVASGGSNLARLGELGGKLLPYFAINRGRSEEEKGSAFLALILSKLLRKIISVKKIQAEALPRHEAHGCVFQERNTCGVATNVYLRKTSEKPEKTWSTNFKTMATPPASPPPPLPPPPADASASSSTLKQTHKATWLRSLVTRPPGAERPVVNIDPTTGKANGPHKKKLRTYLGIVTRDKVDVTYKTLKEVPAAQKDLIWEDIQTVGERWRQLKSDLTRKWALAANKDGVDDIDVRTKAQAIQKQNTAPNVLSRGGYEYLEQKLMAEKTKKRLEEAAYVIDPPSPIRHHMARTKKAGQMMSEAAKEIVEKITSQGSFVPHGRQDVLTAAIGRPEHPSRVRAAGASVTIKQYFRLAPRTSCTDPTNQRPIGGVDHRKSDLIADGILQPDAVPMQSQGLALPPEPEVGPSGPRVSTKESYVAPSGNDPETGDSDKCGLYIEENPSRLVALGRLYEGSTAVGVEEVKDAEALVPIPTNEVTLVGQALNTFLAWATHLAAVSPAKPPESPDHEVDDPLYLTTLTIPQLFLKPLQVMWDATMFGVFNQNFPLYIKHEDLSEIAHGGNSDVYGFLEPQPIQRSGQSQFESESYIKSWMQSSKRDVYLGAYLNGPDNYLKGIINSALKGLDDTPQPKSKAATRWIVVETIGSREIQGTSHPVRTRLFKKKFLKTTSKTDVNVLTSVFFVIHIINIGYLYNQCCKFYVNIGFFKTNVNDNTFNIGCDDEDDEKRGLAIATICEGSKQVWAQRETMRSWAQELE
ncbi:hypothetical protein HKD37_05G012761 [Glycine soja]